MQEQSKNIDFLNFQYNRGQAVQRLVNQLNQKRGRMVTLSNDAANEYELIRYDTPEGPDPLASGALGARPKNSLPF